MPAGVKLASLGTTAFPSSACVKLPVVMFQILAAPSKPPVASLLPSGLKQSDVTVFPASVFRYTCRSQRPKLGPCCPLAKCPTTNVPSRWLGFSVGTETQARDLLRVPD